ncbi:hypothetical protein [Lachnoclostridium phocaeense]|uniref:hypothetical protein n=1 Tax=Lachnoclostridium phocaeense TaxID=1871021 RepID=UPI00248DFAED|nr:hypothetical protein [Lachnoclostridium phocaeense]
MKRVLVYVAAALLPAAVLYLADRYHTELEIEIFDYQMRDWKKREQYPERK